MLYPPSELEALQRQVLELVFVLDCSGSMQGQPLAQAKDAIAAALGRLEPRDTFQIIRFSRANSAPSRCSRRPPTSAARGNTCKDSEGAAARK